MTESKKNTSKLMTDEDIEEIKNYVRIQVFYNIDKLGIKEIIFNHIYKSSNNNERINSPSHYLNDEKYGLKQLINKLILDKKDSPPDWLIHKINSHIQMRIIEPFMMEGYIYAMFKNANIECRPAIGQLDLEGKVDLGIKYNGVLKYIQVKHTKVKDINEIKKLDDLSSNHIKTKIRDEQKWYKKSFKDNIPYHIIAVEEKNGYGSDRNRKKRSFFVLNNKTDELTKYASFEGLQYKDKYNQCDKVELYNLLYPDVFYF